MIPPNDYTHLTPDPYHWEPHPAIDPLNPVSSLTTLVPTLSDQVAITAATEFDFLPPDARWLTQLVEATLVRLIQATH